MSSEEKTPLISPTPSGPDATASARSSGSDGKYDSNSRKSFYFLQRTGSQASDSNTKRRSGDGESACSVCSYVLNCLTLSYVSSTTQRGGTIPARSAPGSLPEAAEAAPGAAPEVACCPVYRPLGSGYSSGASRVLGTTPERCR